MACPLTFKEGDWVGKTTTQVKVKVVADNTKLVEPTYDDKELPVVDNSTTFKIENGEKLLQLTFSGPSEPVGIFQVCDDGDREMFSFDHKFQPIIGFNIVGQGQ